MSKGRCNNLVDCSAQTQTIMKKIAIMLTHWNLKLRNPLYYLRANISLSRYLVSVTYKVFCRNDCCRLVMTYEPVTCENFRTDNSDHEDREWSRKLCPWPQGPWPQGPWPQELLNITLQLYYLLAHKAQPQCLMCHTDCLLEYCSRWRNGIPGRFTTPSKSSEFTVYPTHLTWSPKQSKSSIVC